SFGSGKNIVVEFSSPNIAKPFGIGHLRSTIIGNSLGKICEANGFKVIRINYLGDWGTGFGRMIFGFKKWGDEKKLDKDPIKYLLNLYVKANDESYADNARSEFKKLEDGDLENIALWKKFKDLSLEKFNELYDLMGIKFDVISGESIYNSSVKQISLELKKKNMLKTDNGAKIVDLKDVGLGVALIQKSDGASLYVTRDLAAAIEREKKYKFEKMIYEVGSEQTLHFKQLFYILDKMGYSWAKNCVHVTHGLYMDKDGKRFATRKGKTIFMEDILDEVIEKAKKNLISRETLNEKELQRRSVRVAIAAIFYGDLKNNRINNVVFDVDRFLNFEGDTGTYILYSYARASSICRRVKSKKAVKIMDLKNEEIRLLKKINSFEEVLAESYNRLAPNLMANYCFELATLFNGFYHSCPVLGGTSEGFRLKLVEAFRITIKKGLDLLGIGTLEEM
ncbi:MAG: arginine--tRNA ligase, partial [Nanoarchaeota archaeon]|nr:arginine--tRNA ligase [Nanoarchaeota archaeon]